MNVCISNLKILDNKIILQKEGEECESKKILKKHTGNSKSCIYEFKHKGKNYISYIEDYIIPTGKSSEFINISEMGLYKFVGKDKKSIKELFKELNYHYEINRFYSGLTPKVISVVIFAKNNKVRCQVVTESAHENGFVMVGDLIDNNRLDLELGIIDPPKNDRDEVLFNYMKMVEKSNKKVKGLNFDFYSRFFNPLYIKTNLETWYKKVSHFFDPFFRELNKLHKIDIFHHDLHMKNMLMNNYFQFKFLDFGRSANAKETLEIKYPASKYKSKLYLLQNREKRRIEKKIKSIMKDDPTLKKRNSKKELLFCLMMIELNYPDKLKFQGTMQDYEFARHDVDEAVLLNCFGKDYNLKTKFGLKTKKQVEEIQKIQSYYYTEVLLTFKYFIASKYAEANLK